MTDKNNLEAVLAENIEMKKFDFSNSLESIPFSNCESFREIDFLEKTEENFYSKNTNFLIEEKIVWSSRLTNSQYMKIKYCFNTLFKITYPENFYKNILNRKYFTIVGSLKSSDVVCFAIIDIDFPNRNAEILSFGVMKEFQGRQFGSKLMQKLIEEFKVMGITEISLIVQKTNKIAISLYEKFGFIIFKEELNYYKVLDGEEKTAFIMNKSLTLEQFWIFKVFKNIVKKFTF